MKTLVEALIKTIEKNWDGNKIHVQAHSSGYDSRLLSFIIKKLYNKYGKEWLGEMYFICWQPEIDQFLRIMEYEGWSDDHIILIKPDAPATDYFAEAINFEYMGSIFKPHRFIIRCFDYFFDKEVEKLGNNIQLISGLWSDEVLRRGKIWNTRLELEQYMIDDTHFDWGDYDTILPFASDEFITAFENFNMGSLKPDDVKIGMINHLDKGLAKLENYRFKYWEIMKREKYGQHPVYKISPAVREKAQQEYDKSKYRKSKGINITIPNYISNKDSAFVHYMKAAMMEAKS